MSQRGKGEQPDVIWQTQLQQQKQKFLAHGLKCTCYAMNSIITKEWTFECMLSKASFACANLVEELLRHNNVKLIFKKTCWGLVVFSKKKVS